MWHPRGSGPLAWGPTVPSLSNAQFPFPHNLITGPGMVAPAHLANCDFIPVGRGASECAGPTAGKRGLRLADFGQHKEWFRGRRSRRPRTHLEVPELRRLSPGTLAWLVRRIPRHRSPEPQGHAHGLSTAVRHDPVLRYDPGGRQQGRVGPLPLL